MSGHTVLIRMAAVVSAALVVGVFTGCGGHLLFDDHALARARMVRLQDEQILDNLIRVHHGLPPIHLDYAKISGKVNTEASIKGTLADDDNEQQLAAGSTALIEIDEDQSGLEGNAVFKDEFSSEAAMVTGKEGAKLFDRYKEFEEEGGLVILDSAPKEHVIIMKRRAGKYYTIPIGKKKAYLELCRDVLYRQPPESEPHHVVVAECDGDKDILTLKVEPAFPKSVRGRLELSLPQSGRPDDLYTFQIVTGRTPGLNATESEIVCFLSTKNGSAHQMTAAEFSAVKQLLSQRNLLATLRRSDRPAATPKPAPLAVKVVP